MELKFCQRLALLGHKLTENIFQIKMPQNWDKLAPNTWLSEKTESKFYLIENQAENTLKNLAKTASSISVAQNTLRILA